MVIEIANKEIDLKDELKRLVITNLLNSFRMGCHIIVFEDEILEEISKSEHFGTNEKKYAIQLKSKKRYFFHSIKSFKYKVIVDFNNEDSNIKNDCYSINVSYKYFSDYSSIKPITLLTEDKMDAKFYKIILNFYNKVIVKNDFNISFEDYPGGGDRTKYCFEDFKNKNTLCLCLLDNDKKHPKGPKGQTISKFSDDDFSLSKTVLSYDIGVHELENLIPCYIINKVLESAKKGEYTSHQIETFDILKAIFNKNIEAKKYFDYKLGITSKNVFKWDDLYGEFWFPIISGFVKNDCLISKKCTCQSECKVLHGFSANLLEKSIIILSSESMGNLKKNIPQNVLDIWINIGKILLEWSCSLEKVRC
ncbi:hypothetical protein [Aliarcobacter butzleri]|uniref:Uncharacterized protein n=1 Tax=Aliarcobacter butzleri TaxID=28197 RepID=A0AAW7PRA2_9BACT|nr:hypothetical protein [Aliarcobacter butzleri]MDN5063727.1 hypothetical protein [Aliarcobacter butzleri]MDN5064961.1 hypothetical protein [Aliarcobacter butzleri]